MIICLLSPQCLLPTETHLCHLKSWCPPTPPAEPQFRNLAFPTPDSYTGDVGGCEGFLLQCTLAMTQSPCSFPSDSPKISFVVGLLKDKALAWVLAFFKTNTLESYPFADFITKFRTTFNHPLSHDNASKLAIKLAAGNSIGGRLSHRVSHSSC